MDGTPKLLTFRSTNPINSAGADRDKQMQSSYADGWKSVARRHVAMWLKLRTIEKTCDGLRAGDGFLNFLFASIASLRRRKKNSSANQSVNDLALWNLWEFLSSTKRRNLKFWRAPMLREKKLLRSCEMLIFDCSFCCDFLMAREIIRRLQLCCGAVDKKELNNRKKDWNSSTTSLVYRLNLDTKGRSSG